MVGTSLLGTLSGRPDPASQWVTGKISRWKISRGGGFFFSLAPPSSCSATGKPGPPRGKGDLAGLSESAVRTREPECVSVHAHARSCS